jgi:hypothetical protein
MMKKMLFLMIAVVMIIVCGPLQADITFSRNSDWLASSIATGADGHGTELDSGVIAWKYYTQWVEPDDPTVYPGIDYSPAQLMLMNFQPTKSGFYDPVSAVEFPNNHIAFEYETIGMAQNLYVYWNSVDYQWGSNEPPYDPEAPYGKQQWCVAVFTNTFDVPIMVDISGASEIQTAAKGALDGAKVEIAVINAAFDTKTVKWSYEFPPDSPFIDGVWLTFVTSHVFSDFMLESGLQGIELATGESLAFGLRASNLEGGVNGVESQYLRTSWVDKEVTFTASSTAPIALTVNTDPAGLEASVSGAGDYSLGDTALIEAVDFNDCDNKVVYKFDHWTGDVADVNAASTTVKMSSATSVTAVYVATAECGDACHPIPAGSVDGDCEVDIDDIKNMAAGWLATSLY